MGFETCKYVLGKHLKDSNASDGVRNGSSLRCGKQGKMVCWLDGDVPMSLRYLNTWSPIGGYLLPFMSCFGHGFSITATEKKQIQMEQHLSRGKKMRQEEGGHGCMEHAWEPLIQRGRGRE